ncbi:MAG: sialidase [Ferruginibacter sp.]
MKSFIPALLAILLFLAAINISFGQVQDSLWQKLKPYFNPPPKYAGEFGRYRSPLKFYDGSTVKTPADWKKRRIEILNRWQEMLGQWPELVTKPAVEIIETSRRENFTQYHIRFHWRPDEKTEGYLLVPGGKGIKPAVITVFYEPETAIGMNKPYVDFALQLVRRGFIALSIGTDYKTSSRPYAQYYPDPGNAGVQPLSMLGCLAANAWNMLANWPGVDTARIGILGHSYGSKWAMFASCLFEKFACAAWSDGGIVFDESRPNVNYWDPWYLGYYPPPWEQKDPSAKKNTTHGLYPKLVKEGYDLQELHALMAPRPFLVSGGSEDSVDRWIPLNHTVAVNRLLGFENRVGMTNRPDHSPNPESNEILFTFFEYFLKYGGLNEKKHTTP